MEEIDTPIRMKINGIEIINDLAKKYFLDLPREIVRLGYDAEADVLYAHFANNAMAVDSEIVEANENIILGLNDKDETVRITVLNTSKYIM